MERCTWATDTTEEMQAYHDDEWGRPVHEEQQLFELLTLESMQAGLSWAIILNKRETLRAAYDAFDYRKIARYDEKKNFSFTSKSWCDSSSFKNSSDHHECASFSRNSGRIWLL
ncbi:hypothetical protein EfsSVR2332_36690 [Enterococcus faecalis]|uniref:Uncharacterized protein n=1 Tax=Enterococcus faecalis TaxID=1351 RepID=A0AC59HVK0_ENTFL|nr:hypothetical protein EfsSVR2332_36690 [Enterococcus faecalis]